MSDFHLLLHLYRMDMLPLKSQMGPLLEAVRNKDKAAASEWKNQEVWRTLEELISASTHHDEWVEYNIPKLKIITLLTTKTFRSSMSSEVEFVSAGEVEQNWTCSHCTFINSRELPTCEMCNLPRYKSVYLPLEIYALLIPIYLSSPQGLNYWNNCTLMAAELPISSEHELSIITLDISDLCIAYWDILKG